MADKQRSIRGDVNVILNGLIGEGVIAAFETNFDDLEAAGRVRITVVPPDADDPQAAAAAATSALGRFADRVSVTVKTG